MQINNISLRKSDWWSFGLGLGFFPFFPGTMGSLLGVIMAIPLGLLSFYRALGWLVFLTIITCFFVVTTAKKLQGKDHKSIVSDEVIGYLFAVFGLELDIKVWFFAFIFFRFFDISKLCPISWIEKTRLNGIEIVLDDILAGIFANIMTQALLVYGLI